MLVLSRKQSEQIIIAIPGYEPIIICVVRIEGDRVKIGIEANKQIPITRPDAANKNPRSAA